MKRPVRIANCSGFFGDRLAAAQEMVEGGPIDVLTGDWLAELTMLLLARQKMKHGTGYARTFHQQMEQVLPTVLDKGIKVVSNTVDAIPIPEHNVTIKAHKLRLERRQLKQVAYYWFKVGDSFTPSYWQQQLRIAIKNLLGRPEGSALIRVSAVYNDDDQQAVEDIKEFTRLVLPAIYKHLP